MNESRPGLQPVLNITQSIFQSFTPADTWIKTADLVHSIKDPDLACQFLGQKNVCQEKDKP